MSGNFNNYTFMIETIFFLVLGFISIPLFSVDVTVERGYFKL